MNGHTVDGSEILQYRKGSLPHDWQGFKEIPGGTGVFTVGTVFFLSVFKGHYSLNPGSEPNMFPLDGGKLQ